MKFKHLFFAVALFSITPLFYACSDDDNEIPEDTLIKRTNGLYVTNAGNLSNNINGALSIIDFDKETVTNNLFMDVNARSLGGTPQDAVVYGSKMYIAVYGSNVIEVVDKATAKSIKQIIPEKSQGEGPRDIVATEGKVFISMYDGYVSRIDTTNLTIDATIAVGPNPEEMAIANNYLYVTNSDGMNYGAGYINGKSVSKINISSFTEEKKISVGLNPTKICATTNGDVFIIAMGDYASNPATVQKISSNDEVSDVTHATLMTVKDNTLYLINAPYGATANEYIKYDTQDATFTSDFIDKPVDSPCTIAVHPSTGKIYISSYNLVGGYASYTTDGYVNEYSATGKFSKRYDVGVGPCGLTFLVK